MDHRDRDYLRLVGEDVPGMARNRKVFAAALWWLTMASGVAVALLGVWR